jgi:hypothetical protein
LKGADFNFVFKRELSLFGNADLEFTDTLARFTESERERETEREREREYVLYITISREKERETIVLVSGE